MIRYGFKYTFWRTEWRGKRVVKVVEKLAIQQTRRDTVTWTRMAAVEMRVDDLENKRENQHEMVLDILLSEDGEK